VEIGERVRHVRKARGFSSRCFAAAMRLSLTHISRIETGEQGLRCVYLLQLAKVLNVSPMIFFMDKATARKVRKALPPDTFRGVELIG
jgi:transcriptional regulator with XRE-family HTH domain